MGEYIKHMKITVEQRLNSIYERMLAKSEIHGDVEDLVRACAEIAMEEMDIVWDLAVEETACSASPDDELEGFVIINKPSIYKTKSNWGFDYIEYVENL
jgi:hypothetical protein